MFHHNGGSNTRICIEGNTSPGGVYAKARIVGPDYSQNQGAIVGYVALDEWGGGTTDDPRPPTEVPDTGSEEEQDTDVHTISLRSGKFPYPYVALDAANKKVLGWNNVAVHWDLPKGMDPAPYKRKGKSDPYYWPIPATEPILGWSELRREGEGADERCYFVVNTFGTSGSQHGGYIYRNV
jgi:hypothetical protein